MGTTRSKPGNKTERERLRHQLLGSGCPPARIAVEMAARWQFNLRQAWRYTHGLSQTEVAARCNDLVGDGRAPMTGKRISEYEAWPQRGLRPTVHVLALLARVYGTVPRALLGDDELPLLPESERLVLDQLPQPGTTAVPPEPASVAETEPFGPAAVRAAAHASGLHAERAEVTEVGAITLEQLDHDVVQLARSYILTQPAEIFGELIRVRDRVYQLLRRRAHPAQQSHLYLLAGQTCGLLASASMELGCYGAAAEQSRAAWVYAEVIGHNGLKAWLRGTQALIAFWSGNPREAATLAESGREYLQRGTGFVRLCNIESRAWAHLGDIRETRKVIGMGHQARERATEPDQLHDLVGGEFGFDEARQFFCNAGAWVQVGKPVPAIEAAERALRLYATDAERNRRYGGEASARLEMTDGYLATRDLDAAGASLHPVISTAATTGVAQLATRLSEICATLNTPLYRNSREARELAERIRTHPALTNH
ncbi:helix-turn-helix domain-containing protein [Amycolatopsis sp. SID8362]|uniref:helix-turn-helix domain-containing protein n=1 Tax=Amycolatopsis sp. SID8362 TaxID=2690346 RepID=UPI00136930A0|nr:helix-turn-helix domain-containing protein [Amycolatopsis sp. SID8362]NBH06538.1 helix-turn-helix domain-containing protein [Amycolatopsis sp. SID8362]NED43235.1 helix-turn-helix domain-containing protein [Amycolatopsis sp. SID8362]